MTDRPLGAQISHMLKDRGVDVIFGIPGVHNVELYRGIEQAGITHILARHEQGAGFMADGYARASGKPGVAYVISGPGVTNILTPLGQAWSDSVPVLAISSCLDETAARKGQLHQMRDQEGAARTVCDWSETARDPASAYDLIDRALAEFRMQRPRPKHLTVPIAALGSSAPPAPPAMQNHAAPEPGADQVETVLAALREARRPLFVLGGGCARDAVAQVARRVIGRLGAATMCSYAARGVMEADHPLNFGPCLARPFSAEIAASADLVVAVGTTLSEVDLWRAHLGHEAPMIRVDLDPEVLRDSHRAEIAVRCDTQAFFDRLEVALSRTSSETLARDWTPAEVRAARARTRAEADAAYPGVAPVADALRACLPADTMVFSDMTTFAYASKEFWDLDRPGHWHHPFGFGTLGYALPAAIGGAVARPGLPTLCIAGDYGFQYTLPELGTAVELGLPLPILLWDNGKLKAIEDSMIASQIAPNAVIARNPDFLALARAYGAHAVQPSDLAQMQEAVRAAFSADAPTVIRVTPALGGIAG